MSITRDFTIYLNAGISVPPVVHVNQYDQGEIWRFTLLESDGSQYTPSTGALIGVKADGHAIAGVTGTVLGDGRVQITETQQMTAAAGDAIFELTIDGQTHGTANFIVRVEKKPTDDAILSDSDLSIIQEGMNSVTPVVIAETVSDWLEDNLTDPPIDPSLTISNAAADAKVTGDKITDLKTTLNITDTYILTLDWNFGYISSDGEITTNNARAYTNMIPIKLLDIVIDVLNASDNFYLAFYDSKGDYIESKGWFHAKYGVNNTGSYCFARIGVVPSTITLSSPSDAESLITIEYKKADDRTGKYDVTELFMLENLSISGSGWSYGTGVNRVGTKKGITIPLQAGDTIGLTSYTGVKYYLGWKENGTYHTEGWRTSDWVVPYDAEYVVSIANSTDIEQTSKYALASLFFCPIRAFDKIKENHDSIESVVNLPLILSAGFLSSTGIPSNQNSDSLEVYTQKYRCSNGDSFRIELSYGEKKNLWLAYCLYDENGNHITRNVVANNTACIEYLADITISNASAYYIAFTYRTYGQCNMKIYTDVSMEIFRQLETTAQRQNILSVASINENVKAINHRGYNTIAPENTLPAFKLSKNKGFAHVETDVRFTSDSVAVLLHDETVDRTSNGTGYISQMTYAQAEALDFGSWKSDAYAGTKIPTFTEFIKLCKNIGLCAYIELKVGTEAQITSLVDIVKQCGMIDKITWISYGYALLNYVVNYEPSARVGYLRDTLTDADITIANGFKTGENKVFMDLHINAITSENVNKCIAADLPLEAFTLNDESTITAMNPYVSGATSDKLIAGYVLYMDNIS